MFGGSALFGYNAEDKETIPSFLSIALNKQNIPSYIYNFGQIGFTSFQDTLYLQKILKNNVIPNTVIFYNGCNDLFVNATSLKPLSFKGQPRQAEQPWWNGWRTVRPLWRIDHSGDANGWNLTVSQHLQT